MRGSWRLPLLYIPSSTLPPLLRLPTPYSPPPMSHDETHTRDLEPYFTASPSSSTGDNRGNRNGPFSPGNTPPLVFAFIAIGFIVFGLVIALVYKTCRPLPTSSEPYHQRSSVPIRRPSIQKPKLWDIWIAPNQRIPDEKRENFNDWNTFVVSFFFSLSARVDQSADKWPPASISVTCIPLLSLSPYSCAATIRPRPRYSTRFLGRTRPPAVLQTTANGHEPPCRSRDLYAQTTRANTESDPYRERVSCWCGRSKVDRMTDVYVLLSIYFSLSSTACLLVCLFFAFN